MAKFGSTPIRILKAKPVDETGTEAGSKSTTISTASSTHKCEPQVQLMEVKLGVYDIIFTCSCGEKTVIHCESLEKATQE